MNPDDPDDQSVHESIMPCSPEHKGIKTGDQVILESLPPGFLHGLPEEDQAAITAVIGQPVNFYGYCDAWGKLELEFTDKDGGIHTIWVDEKFIKRLDEKLPD